MPPRRCLANSQTSTRHSSVIVIGPFEPQIYDLSSSSESGSSTGHPSLSLTRATCGSVATSPVTPTKRPGKVIVQPQSLFQSPANQPDWVAYSEPIHGLEDVDMASSDSETESAPADEGEADNGADQAEEWTLLRVSCTLSHAHAQLQALQLERSKSAGPRFHTRPFLAERIIPLKLPQVKPRPAPIFIPQTQVPEMVLNPLPIPSFAPMTPPTSASHDTLVACDLDSGPSRLSIKIKEEAVLLDHVVACSACEATGTRMVHLLPCGVSSRSGTPADIRISRVRHASPPVSLPFRFPVAYPSALPASRT